MTTHWLTGQSLDPPVPSSVPDYELHAANIAAFEQRLKLYNAGVVIPTGRAGPPLTQVIIDEDPPHG